MRGSFLAKIASLFALGLASGADMSNARIKAHRSLNGGGKSGAAAQKRAARKLRRARARSSKRA